MKVSEKNKTVYIEATVEDQRVKIGFRESDDVIWQYDYITADMEKIKISCRKSIEELNRIHRKGESGTHAFNLIRDWGNDLTRILLPRNISIKLAQTDIEYMIIRLDDHLVHVPWELLRINDQFICERFCVGRIVNTRQKIEKSRERIQREYLQAWILADPVGDLKNARFEGQKIFDTLCESNQKKQTIIPSLDSNVSADSVIKKLMNYDLIHFAGHADYNEQHPDQSGWRLSGGNLTSGDIDGLSAAGLMPFLIFSNACQSARTDEWESPSASYNTSFGLANAFLRAGVKHYVGPFWEITDKPGSLFAVEFYKQFCAGKTVGEAIRETRQTMKESLSDDMCRFSYLLYGDPRVSYFNDHPEIKRRTASQSSSTASVTRSVESVASSEHEEFKFGKSFQYAIIIIMLGLIGFGVTIAGNYISGKKETERLRIELDQKKLLAERRSEVEQVLAARTKEIRERTERLFDELIHDTGHLTFDDSRNSEVTLAAVFDSHVSAGGKEQMVLHAVRDGILEAGLPITLLDRVSFDVILTELIRNRKMTPPDKRPPLKLLKPAFLLILQTHETEETLYVSMSVSETESGVIRFSVMEEMDNRRPLLGQKEELTQNLLNKLKEL